MSNSRMAVLAVLFLASSAGGGCAPELAGDGDLAAGSGEVVVGPAPDYVTTAVERTPAQVALGATFTATTTVENVGDADAVAISETRYLLSTDPIVDAGDIRGLGAAQVPPLPVGTADTQDVTLTLPGRTPAGTYFLIGCADRGRTVRERDELNNCTASAATISVIGPDLVVEEVLDPSPHLIPGRQISFGDTIANRGDATAADAVIDYFLSPVPARVPGAFQLGARATGELAPGATSSVRGRIQVPSIPPGTYFLVVCVDINNIVPERDNGNNCRASAGTTTRGPGNLVVSALEEPPPSAVPGDTFLVTDTTANTGDLDVAASTARYFLSADDLPGGDVELIGARAVPRLPLDLISVGTTQVRIPFDTPAGDYRLIACADADSAVAESSETDNCRASAGRVVVEPLDTTCGDDTGGIVIDGVATSDGFTQVRQGTLAELVITGSGLETATRITLGEIEAEILSAGPDELRVDVLIADTTAPGPRPITVRGAPGPGCSVQAAIELTPIVVAPVGAPDGRGTFQSPLDLCAPDLETIAVRGSTVLLLAGEHHCPRAVVSDAEVVGEGVGSTIVNGSIALRPSRQHAASLHDMTIVSDTAPAVDVDAGSSGGRAVVRDLVAVGTGIRIAASFNMSATAEITDYEFTGPGPGLEVSGNMVATASRSRFTSCTTGVLVGADFQRPGQLQFFDSAIEGCATGIRIVGGIVTATRVAIAGSDEGIHVGESSSGGVLFLRDSVVNDSTVGILAELAGVQIFNSTIAGDPATARPNEQAILFGRGRLDAQAMSITGHRVGIEVDVPAHEGTGFGVGMGLAGVNIQGGERGLHVHGFPDSGTVSVVSSVMSDQTVASVAWAVTAMGLQIHSSQLSVLSGFALDDARTQPSPSFPTISALAMTLNGRSYAGQLVQGPASLPPDYRIVSANAIQF